METDAPPQILYYTTVYFEDDTYLSPHFMVFEKPSEGVLTIRNHYADQSVAISSITMKEVEFVSCVLLTPECTVLTPIHDHGIDDDFRDPIEQADMVDKAEALNPSQALMGILPFEQEIDEILCRAFYMGPFVRAISAEEYIQVLQEEPFTTSMPLDMMWLYRPTGEWKEVGGGE